MATPLKDDRAIHEIEKGAGNQWGPGGGFDTPIHKPEYGGVGLWPTGGKNMPGPFFMGGYTDGVIGWFGGGGMWDKHLDWEGG